MKKIVFLMALFALATTACKNLPPLEDLSSNFVVLTNYDTTANFTSYRTFAVRDTIQLITSDPKDSVWYDAGAQQIIQEVVDQMTAAGYQRVDVHSNPDLGLQLVGLKNTTIYAIPPGYWWGYPGWGSPCYWGYCGGWGYWYPYYYTVAVSTGTLVVDMADLKDASDHIGKINIVWNIVGNGQIGSGNSFIIDQCVRTVKQGFLQSPYIKAQ